MDEHDHFQKLAQRLAIPFLRLERVVIGSEALDTVPPEMAKSHGVIPVKRDGRYLWLAMSDPNDLAAIDNVTLITGLQVITVLATPDDVADAQRRYYP